MSELLKRWVRSALGVAGLGLVRLRDPYAEIARLLSADDIGVVVDGGAYRGAAVLRLHALFPHAAIHAFEPQQESFELLRERVGHLGRVHLHPMALSDADGDRAFFVSDRAYMSSLLPACSSAIHQVRRSIVPVRTLDSMFADREAPVEVIKLDLQGHELAALRGGTRTLDRCRALLVEVNFRHRYEDACSFEELAGFLDTRGFGLYRLYDIAHAADTGWLNADALFLRPRPIAA